MNSSIQEKNDFLIRLLSCGDNIKKHSSGFEFKIGNDAEVVSNNIKGPGINIIIKQLTHINGIDYIDNCDNLKIFLDALIEKYTIQQDLLCQNKGFNIADNKYKYIDLLKRILRNESVDNEFNIVIEEDKLGYNINIKGKEESIKIEIPLNTQIVDTDTNSDKGLLSIINITFHIMSNSYYKTLNMYMPYYEVVTYPKLKNKLDFSLPNENFNEWIKDIKHFKNKVSTESQKKLSYALLDKELNILKIPNKKIFKKQKI